MVILVCLPLNISAKITTFDCSPLEPCIVMTLTASLGGIVTASSVLPLLSLRFLILSARIIGSPPTSLDKDLMMSIVCSMSCLETISGYATRISDLSIVSSNKSIILPEEESSIHL